jgi:hypothetical protein
MAINNQCLINNDFQTRGVRLAVQNFGVITENALHDNSNYPTDCPLSTRSYRWRVLKNGVQIYDSGPENQYIDIDGTATVFIQRECFVWMTRATDLTPVQDWVATVTGTPTLPADDIDIEFNSQCGATWGTPVLYKFQ